MELLIVIVVIGILAAITIVAYSGISERARVASISSALSQSSKKLTLYMVDNGTYPSVLSEMGITDANNIKYQYSVKLLNNPQTFCITATSGTTSYSVTQSGAPVAGACAGHGVGGAVAVTNLVTNPSFESNTTAWSSYVGVSPPTRSTANPLSGAYRLSSIGNNTAANPRVYYALPVTTGETISVTASIRSDGQTPVYALLVIKIRLAGSEKGTPVNVTLAWAPDTNGWMKVTATYTVPADIDSLMIQPGLQMSSNFTGTLGVDAVIAVKGPSPVNYADGESLNWIWNGTPNASTSTGSPL